MGILLRERARAGGTATSSTATDIARAHLAAALSDHARSLHRLGIDPAQLLDVCDPSYLLRLAGRSLDAAREQMRTADSFMLPPWAELMLDHALSVEDRVRASVGQPGPVPSPGAGTGAASTLNLPVTSAVESAAPGTGGTLGGGIQPGGGRPAIGGIYIIWKDLNKDLWPSYLQIIPELLFAALDAALGQMAAQAMMDGAVWWEIQPIIARASMQLSSVALVVPPFIIPNFDPPKGMQAASLGRYEENVQLLGRLFLLGVPIGGRPVIAPPLKPKPFTGSGPLFPTGRPMTAESLLSPAGMQRALDDARDELKKLGPALLQQGCKQLTQVMGDYIVGLGRDIVFQAIQTMDLTGFVNDLTTGVTDLVDWARRTGLAPVEQMGDTLALAWKELTDDSKKDLDPGGFLSKATTDAIKASVAETVTEWQYDILRGVKDALFSLSSRGVATTFIVEPGPGQPGVIKNAWVKDGFGRKIEPGWWVRVGEPGYFWDAATSSAVVRTVVPSARVASVQYSTTLGFSIATITFDKEVVAPKGTQLFAYPEDWTDLATVDVWMLVNMAAERTSSFAANSIYDGLFKSRITNLQQDLTINDPPQQQAAIQDSLSKLVDDMAARRFGAADFDQLQNGDIGRIPIRLLDLASGDNVNIHRGGGKTYDPNLVVARWHFASGSFTADDVGRAIRIAGAGLLGNVGDFPINLVLDPTTVETDAGSLGDEQFGSQVAAQVELFYREPHANTIRQLEAKAIGKLGDLVQSKLESQAKRWGESLVKQVSHAGLNMGQVDAQIQSLGGTTLSSIISNSASSVGQDVQRVARAANIFDYSRDLDSMQRQLQATGSYLLDDLNRQLYNVGNGAMREVFARLFIFTCVVGFELKGGVDTDGGGFLADWSANILIDNRFERCTARTHSPGGNGGGYCLRGSLPNLLILNEFHGNIAEVRGGAIHCDSGSMPILMFNDVTHNQAQFGGGLDFAAGAVPIAIFNDIIANSAVGNPSGVGGGIRAESQFGFLLFNAIKRNSATLDGGGMYLDGGCTLAFNEVSRNWAGRSGGGLCMVGGGSIGLNEISGNRARRGGGIAVDRQGGGDFSTNFVSANAADDGGGYAVIGARSRPMIADEVSGNRATRGGGVYVHPEAQPSLGGCEVFGNGAREGGGVYLDGVRGSPAFTGFAGVTAAGNTATVRGGGLFAIRDLIVSGSVFAGNRAGLYGGGVFAQCPSRLGLSSSAFLGNTAGAGGGVAVFSSGRLESVANAFASNMALTGEGGALLSQSTASVSLLGDVFARNYTRGANGGAVCARDGAELLLSDVTIRENQTRVETDPVTVPGPAGGGVYAERFGRVQAEACTAFLNAAEFGGALALADCAQGGIFSSVFTDNYADLDRDGEGAGGAVYASGRGSVLRVGGDARTEGCVFTYNSAGTPDGELLPGSGGVANGGALAVVDGPTGLVEGNGFGANAATHDGGAVYFRDTGADSGIGGENDALPATTGGRRLGNLFIENCEVIRRHQRRPPCCPPPFIPEIPWETPLIPDSEIPQERVPVPLPLADGPPEPVPSELPPPQQPTDAPPPTISACVPCVTLVPPVFRRAGRPGRPAMKRQVDWLKPVQADVNAALDRLPPDKQILLMFVAPTATQDFRLYSTWPAEADQRARYGVATDTSASLPGWAPVLDWSASNIGGTGWDLTRGSVSVNDDLEYRPIGPIVTRRGGGVALIRGDGTTVHGNLFDLNYAVQFGGATLVDGSSAQTFIGVPSSVARYGRNDFRLNFSTCGGALALVGGTTARVVWNRIGGSRAASNYATAGGGVFVLQAAPAIGGLPGETTEVTDNLAGHRVPPADAKLFPPAMAAFWSAGLLAFGGGVAVAGAGRSSSGPTLENVALERNVVQRPRGIGSITSALSKPTPGTPSLLAGSPPGTYLAGGGAAFLLDARATVRSCTIADNEVVGAHLTPALQAVYLAGGGIMAGFDHRAATAPVPSAPTAAAAGCVFDDLAINSNRVRIVAEGMNAVAHELLGGGIALLEAAEPRILASHVLLNSVLRQPARGPTPRIPGTLALRGGGIAMRDCDAAEIAHTRVERNHLVDLDAPQAAQGGGIFAGLGSGRIADSWVVQNHSHRDGGGVALLGAETAAHRPGRFQLVGVTIADNDALSRGGALFADFDLLGSRVERSILDAFGAWDSPAAWGGKRLSQPRLIVDSCLWSPMCRAGVVLGGTLQADPTAPNIEADPGYAAPDAWPSLDYSLRRGSPCRPSGGTAIGYDPHPSQQRYRARRYTAPSAGFPTLAATLAAARPGDVIDVAPRHYREVLRIPDGVVVRSVAGPTRTFIELPSRPGTVGALVTLQAARRRSGFAGFTVKGRDEIPIPPVPPPPWTGTRARAGIRADARYQGYLTGNVAYWWETGIEVAAAAATGPPLGHSAWVGGNTAAQCRRVGIHVTALEGRGSVTPRTSPCRAPAPPTPTYSPPVVMPYIEHNIAAGNLVAGLRVDATTDLAPIRVGFNDLHGNRAELSGLEPDAINENDNASVDPGFRDPARQDFRLAARTASITAARNAKDGRYRGALG